MVEKNHLKTATLLLNCQCGQMIHFALTEPVVRENAVSKPDLHHCHGQVESCPVCMPGYYHNLAIIEKSGICEKCVYWYELKKVQSWGVCNSPKKQEFPNAFRFLSIENQEAEKGAVALIKQSRNQDVLYHKTFGCVNFVEEKD